MKALNPLSAFVCGLRPGAVFVTCKLPLLAVISSAGLAAHAQSTATISGAIDGGLAYVKTDRYSQLQTASGSIAASSLVFQGIGRRLLRQLLAAGSVYNLNWCVIWWEIVWVRSKSRSGRTIWPG
jgi:hypothetical protein